MLSPGPTEVDGRTTGRTVLLCLFKPKVSRSGIIRLTTWLWFETKSKAKGAWVRTDVRMDHRIRVAGDHNPT